MTETPMAATVAPTVVLPTPSLVQRYECKYELTESEARAVLRSLRPFVQPDPHAAKRPGFVYPICSLYLDHPSMALYHETVEGKASRYKLRVRSYSDNPASPLFFEVKRRVNGVVHKTRCTMGKQHLATILHGASGDWPDLEPRQRAGLSEFMRLMLKTVAAPQCLVRYDREAWVGSFDKEVRITFDRRLRTTRMDHPLVAVDGVPFVSVPMRGVVLELKFNDRCPSWLTHIVQRHELRRTSFSKYCNAMDRARHVPSRVGLPRSAS